MLERLAELYVGRGNTRRAIEVYQALLTQDPYQEDVHRQLMLCHQRRDNRAAAIQQYLVCARILREDLALSAAPETKALYLEIVA